MYEDERTCPKKKIELGTFELFGIPAASRGVPQVEVKFDVDTNGIMNVSAVNKAFRKANHIAITNKMRCLSKEDIEKMVAEAERFKAEDNEVRAKAKARNGPEQCCYAVKSNKAEGNVKEEPAKANVNAIQSAVTNTL